MRFDVVGDAMLVLELLRGSKGYGLAIGWFWKAV